LERRDLESVRAMSMDERGILLAAACRDAAAVERSRIESGLPPSQPAPWPASTWAFLAEAVRRLREQ
jgi:hypothetical protein